MCATCKVACELTVAASVYEVFNVLALISLACPELIPVFAVFAVIALACPELIPVFAVLATIA